MSFVFSYLYKEGAIYKCLTVDQEGTEIAGGQISDYINENNEIILYPKYIAKQIVKNFILETLSLIL